MRLSVEGEEQIFVTLHYEMAFRKASRLLVCVDSADIHAVDPCGQKKCGGAGRPQPGAIQCPFDICRKCDWILASRVAELLEPPIIG